MIKEHPSYSAGAAPNTIFGSQRRTLASYERELADHRRAEIRLRETIAQDKGLPRQKDELMQNLAALEPGIRSYPRKNARFWDPKCPLCLATHPR